MSKTLHIFNGDSTKSLFLKSDLEGEYVVWREMLCSGPTIADIHSTDFWKLRQTFIHDKYGAENYKEIMYKPLNQINWKAYDSIMFWFEYDLFCLTNFVAAITYISPLTNASLRAVDLREYQLNPIKHLKALGEFHPNQYPKLNQQTVQISDKDIDFAKECWGAYSSEKHHISFFKNCNYSSAAFPFLSLVLPQHLARIPQKNSYSELDKHIHELLKTNTEKQTLLNCMSNSHLGYGDSQWSWHINRVINHSPLDPDNWNKLYDYKLGAYTLNTTKNIN